MIRHLIISFLTSLVLVACTTTVTMGPDGKPLPNVYYIKPSDKAKIQFRVLDSINAVRAASKVRSLELDSILNAAAVTHSTDMSIQNRAWHFGSDGSSPIDRVSRLSYSGRLIGENISETYETEIETLSAWLQQPDTRDVILSPKASKLGFAWVQEPNGKIWWTLITGD